AHLRPPTRASAGAGSGTAPSAALALPAPPRHGGSSRHSKLEKADILEMTVKHLRSLQRAQMTAALSTDPTVLGKYRAGFSECMNEVTRFLSTCEGVNTEVRTRLLGHLASCMTQINAMNYPAPPPPGAGPLPAKVYGGFQLLPASDGQFAFLIPSTAFAPGGAVLPLYGGPPTAATAASPPGPPPGTADSVWRPW
uniref:Hes family bHLH transcription factor 1 n=1 Tax=Otus sunia TaxID=257818 RepID=A0A8C8AJK7_9STRI